VREKTTFSTLYKALFGLDDGVHFTARASGISYQGLQAIEKGADPHVSRLSRIAAALGVTIVDLLDKDRFSTSLAAAVEGGQEG